MKSVLGESIERVYQFSSREDHLTSSAYEKIVPRLRAVPAGRLGSHVPRAGELRRVEGGILR